MTYQVRVKLMNQFDELREKRKILPYYVSLDFPEKQRKLVVWWGNMIEAAIRFSNQAYLSPNQLEVIFTLHGLKPVPLPRALQILSNTQNFEWRDRSILIQQQTGFKAMISSILKFIIPQKSVGNRLTKFEGFPEQKNSKVVSTAVMREQLVKIKDLFINEIELDHNISYDFIVERLNKVSSLSTKAIEYLINQLHNKSWVVIVEANKKKVILYSEEISYYQDPKWIELQKSKFGLKLAINSFKNQINKKMQEENELLHQAKTVASKDKNKAKQILAKVLNIRKMNQQLQNRSTVLQNQLSQIEINEADGQVVGLLEDAQRVIKLAAQDPDKLDKIAEENAEIQMKQRQLKDAFEKLNGDDDQIEDQVDEMMKSLEKEVKIKKNRQKESPAKFVKAENVIDVDDILEFQT